MNICLLLTQNMVPIRFTEFSFIYYLDSTIKNKYYQDINSKNKCVYLHIHKKSYILYCQNSSKL